jgi:N-succinyldiaminopimelate aminotransferase
MWNRRFLALDEFPFRRLAALLAGIDPAGRSAVGGPLDRRAAACAAPAPGGDAGGEHAHLWNKYPPPSGTPAFRDAAADWLTRRFALPTGLARA